jgi:hypothetical protein
MERSTRLSRRHASDTGKQAECGMGKMEEKSDTKKMKIAAILYFVEFWSKRRPMDMLYFTLPTADMECVIESNISLPLWVPLWPLDTKIIFIKKFKHCKEGFSFNPPTTHHLNVKESRLEQDRRPSS